MKFPNKPPVAMSAIASAAGLPPGKKMSVRNMARLKPAKAPRRPKPAAYEHDSDYR
jgi:hypothetical protein